jgi:hypothetical protein
MRLFGQFGGTVTKPFLKLEWLICRAWWMMWRPCLGNGGLEDRIFPPVYFMKGFRSRCYALWIDRSVTRELVTVFAFMFVFSFLCNFFLSFHSCFLFWLCGSLRPKPCICSILVVLRLCLCLDPLNKILHLSRVRISFSKNYNKL